MQEEKTWRRSQSVVLGLGSNRSFAFEGKNLDPLEILERACQALSHVFQPEHFFYSSVYKTKAMYYENQADFYNMVVIGDYAGDPQSLLKKTQEIERLLGRDRTREIPKGPRSLDIDIVLFYDEIVQSPLLEIPHPRIKERAFVLLPLLELLPESADPISGQLFKESLDLLAQEDIEIYKINII